MTTKSIILFALTALSSLSVLPLHAVTVEEKRQQLTSGTPKIEMGLDDRLTKLNQELADLKEQLREKTAQAWELQRRGAPGDEFAPLLREIRELREKMIASREEWRQRASAQNSAESYGLWNQLDISIEQLIGDYGSLDYVYLIPKEVAEMRVALSSNLPVPRENWGEMLALVLAESGIGIHQANPYLRVLYADRHDQAHLALITDRRTDLELLSPDSRIGFVLKPDAPEVGRIYTVLSRLSDNARTSVHVFGGQIVVVASVPVVQEILKVYDFLQQKEGLREFRMITLHQGEPVEMAALLNVIFAQPEKGPAVKEGGAFPVIQEGLTVMPLKNLPLTLFLAGTSAQIRRAEEILDELQQQLSETQAKTIFWYTCLHSDAEELAQILSKVYSILKSEKVEGGVGERGQPQPPTQPEPTAANQEKPPREEPNPIPPSIYEKSSNIVVNPAGVNPAIKKREDTLSKRDNFIVDPKTGSIIMVLDPISLERIQELLKKLDVPKTMVRIDVILFEKKVTERTNYGLDFLQIGDSVLVPTDAAIAAGQSTPLQTPTKNTTGATWNTDINNPGIFSYLMTRIKTKHLPAFNLSYTFLMNQDDVTVNANPSVTTINQTKTSIKLVEERSISEGRQIQNVSGQDINTETFTRAQYGIIIEVTPTVHLAGTESSNGTFQDYVTLETNITFDTTAPDVTDRPVVTRRNVTNQVLVPDGHSVILGGLRRRESRDAKGSIPGVGEIPLFGKAFSKTITEDITTETFMILTPKIIVDPKEEFKRIERMELAKRPGDVPEFLDKLRKAEECERDRLFFHTMTMLLGPQIARTRAMETYDGR